MVLPTDQRHFEKHWRGRRENHSHSLGDSPPSGDFFLHSIYTGFYLCWSLSILKSSIIAEIPPLFKLIYFLMVYLHSGICIWFHSKCYDSTCPILDKTPKLREKIEALKEVDEYKTFLTHPCPRGSHEPSSLDRTWKTLMLPALRTSALAFCFNLLSCSKSWLLQFHASKCHKWCWATPSSLWGYTHCERQVRSTCRGRMSYQTSTSILLTFIGLRQTGAQTIDHSLI